MNLKRFPLKVSVNLRRSLIVLFFVLTFFCVGKIASAHEVYVLDHAEIVTALAQPMPNYAHEIATHLLQFFGWIIFGFFAISAVLIVSIVRPIERAIDPVLHHLKKAAPIIAQVTLGLSFLASGYFHATFGPELPMAQFFGSQTMLVSVIFMIVGGMLLCGVFSRVASVAAIVLFIIITAHYGTYMLNYGTYLGEALVLAVFGGAYQLWELEGDALNKLIPKQWHDYKFLIMRIFFGISLIYASLYAKLFHGALALETIAKYHLTNYFHFDPLFLALGAMLIEVSLGLFFMFGFEIRFASIFFLVFLTMSLCFFGEVVWPHIILIGTAFAMFAHGYDPFCVSSVFGRKSKLEPVL